LPLSEKARVEVYLPHLPQSIYQDLLRALRREFTYTFGGCTVIGDIEGSYLSPAGSHIQDRINLIYTDTPYAFKEHFKIISTYVDKLKAATFAALEEDAILVAIIKTYHGE
jgi:hypothetical protein